MRHRELYRSVDQIIEDANFDENDLDLATTGLCGTFALSLYKALYALGHSSQLYLLCNTNTKNKVVYAREHQGDYRYLIWRHAMIKTDVFYDVEGKLKIEDAIANYCWNAPGGRAIPLGLVQFTNVIRNTKSSYDGRYFVYWRNKLLGIK